MAKTDGKGELKRVKMDQMDQMDHIEQDTLGVQMGGQDGPNESNGSN